MCIAPVTPAASKGMPVPCGKCPKCKLRRANAWAFRLSQEAKRHVNSVFLTLTYAPEHVPRTKNGFATLNKRDIQLFMKRLRKNTGCKTIKYYCAGEYGGQTKRPHYHLIIYDALTYDEKGLRHIDKSWTLGHCHVGELNERTIAYTLKYISKPSQIPMFQKDDRVKEFSMMSRGIGLNYLTPQTVQWHQANKFSFVVLNGGHKQCLPRYYRDRIFTEQERLDISAKTVQRHVTSFDKMVRDAGGIQEYYDRRFERVRAAIREFNQKHLKLKDKL